MKLSEIRDYIGNILDYQPNITGYKDQLTAVINEQYFRLFSTKPFTFAQREALVAANKDVEYTDLSVTNGSSAISTGASTFDTTMEGQIIALDSVEYTIAWVTGSNAYLTTEYAGATATVAGTVRYRYIDMPQDCVEIMQVLKRAMTLTPQEPGRMVPVTRYEDEFYNLPLNEVNLPNYWVPFDDFSLLPPKQAPTVAATTSGSGHGVRTVEFAVSYVFGGRESALSPTTKIALTDTQIAQFTFVARTNFTGRYYRVYARNTDKTINKFYHISDTTGSFSVVPSFAGTKNYTVALGNFTDNFELFFSPYSGVDGNYQRIRLYPRQSQDFSLTVRYMYRPKKLIDDGDTPEFPAAHHQVLAYMALRDIFIKHDNNAQATLYDRKVAQEMLKIEQRYLNSIAKRYIKRFMEASRTDPVPLYTPLTQT